jgi:hypothetical protein
VTAASRVVNGATDHDEQDLVVSCGWGLDLLTYLLHPDTMPNAER